MGIKAWIADQLWNALKLFLGRVHDWVFSPERNARIRMKNRKRWWRYHLKAQRTNDKRDDMRAKAWQIQFKFETSPEDAEERGDLREPYRCH